MKHNSIFAQRLKETRQKENMTQKDLAEKFDHSSHNFSIRKP